MNRKGLWLEALLATLFPRTMQRVRQRARLVAYHEVRELMLQELLSEAAMNGTGATRSIFSDCRSRPSSES